MQQTNNQTTTTTKTNKKTKTKQTKTEKKASFRFKSLQKKISKNLEYIGYSVLDTERITNSSAKGSLGVIKAC